MSGRKILFVSGFSRDARAKDLAYEFERYGRLVRCDIPSTRGGGGASYAFIEFRNERDAEDAYHTMHGQTIDRHRISVQWARRPPSALWRHDAPRGSRGGRDRGDRGDRDRDRGDRDRSRSRSRSPRRSDRDRDSRRRSRSPRSRSRDRRDRDEDREERVGREDREDRDDHEDRRRRSLSREASGPAPTDKDPEDVKKEPIAKEEK